MTKNTSATDKFIFVLSRMNYGIEEPTFHPVEYFTTKPTDKELVAIMNETDESWGFPKGITVEGFQKNGFNEDWDFEKIKLYN